MSTPMDTPSFYSEPQVLYLQKILQDVGRGFIQVPRFQRPLIWELDRQLELLRSIRSSIPIGAIMVWRTTRTDLDYYRSIGPYRIPDPRPSGPRQYLLDGVQRLSTLYGALCHPGALNPTLPRDASPVFEFFFDLEQNDFRGLPRADSAQLTLFDDSAPLAEHPSHLPLRYLFDGVRLLRFQRQLESDAWVRAVDELAEAFRNYKVAVFPITTDDLNQATRTFQLINSQGVTMSEFHMVHALTYSSGFHLESRIEDLWTELLAPIGWSEFERASILRLCKAALGMHMYTADIADFSAALKKQPEILTAAVRAIRSAITFLRERCGVWSPELLPYEHQVLMVAEAFRLVPEPDSVLLDLLEAWFWISTYGQLFSSMTGDRVQHTLEAIRRMVEERGALYWTGHNSQFKRSPIPVRFGWAAARSRAIALRLGLMQAKQEGYSVFAQYGRSGVGRLIPREEAGTELFSSTANCIVVEPGKPDELREQLLTGSDPAQLAAHAMNREIIEALHARDYRGFGELRRELLDALEEEHLQAVAARFQIESC